MSKKTTGWVAGVCTVIFVVEMLMVIRLSPTTSVGFTDPTTVFAFVAGAAIAIERVIELFWTILGGLVGTYWPLNTVGDQVKTMTKQLDEVLKPFHKQAAEELDTFAQNNHWSLDQVKEAKDEIEALKKRFDDLVALAPDNQRAQLLAAAASQNICYLKKKYGNQLGDLNLAKAASIAETAIDGLQNFLATFKDNPGRRLISIYAGMMLGLIVAGVYSLDVFKAALDISFYPGLSIALTGILMGLGSNPTHEVIRAIQEYKKNRKGENLATPDLPASQIPSSAHHL